MAVTSCWTGTTSEGLVMKLLRPWALEVRLRHRHRPPRQSVIQQIHFEAKRIRALTICRRTSPTTLTGLVVM